METSTLVRQRRPFLTPIWITVLLGVLAAAVAFEVYRSATTTTFIIVPSAQSEFVSIHDAPLSPEGEQRADQLVRLFGDAEAPARIAAIYVTSMRRTEQTAAPLAARLALRPIVADKSPHAIVSQALKGYRGQTVMIVSSEPLAVVRALTGIAVAAHAQADPGRIFIVSDPLLGRAGLVELHY